MHALQQMGTSVLRHGFASWRARPRAAGVPGWWPNMAVTCCCANRSSATANVAYILLRICLQGGAPGLLGWWPDMAVTFLDNHDTDPSGSKGARDRVLPFPQDYLDAGYAYLMTHPGGCVLAYVC